MSFKFMSWNVKHFRGGSKSRIEKVDAHIGAEDPDVFGIIEFQAKDAARKIVTKYYHEYDFGMTDSKMGLDFLIGWRREKFQQVIYTQRREFMAGNINLRPGGLLSFLEEGKTAFTNMLFLDLFGIRPEAMTVQPRKIKNGSMFDAAMFHLSVTKESDISYKLKTLSAPMFAPNQVDATYRITGGV